MEVAHGPLQCCRIDRPASGSSGRKPLKITSALLVRAIDQSPESESANLNKVQQEVAFNQVYYNYKIEDRSRGEEKCRANLRRLLLSLMHHGFCEILESPYKHGVV